MTPLSALDILKYPQSGDEADIKEAVQCAISALEKQIPKKVEITEDCCICPRCIFDMMGVYDFTDHNTKDPAYCPSCGQALDWSDTE